MGSRLKEIKPWYLSMSEIAVVLPVYNGLKFLDENIKSVLNQQYRNFTFLICDDCSTDGSWDYLSQLNDSRITLFRNEHNKGLFATLNFLCKNAESKLIKIWSQDDVMNPDCLGETVAFHNKYPGISFSYSAFQHIDEAGNVIAPPYKDLTPEYIPRQLHDKIALYCGSIAGNICNVTIVKEKLEEVGYFDERMTIAADFDMWVKLTEQYDIGRISKALVKQRTHGNQLSKAAEHYMLHMTEEKIIFERLFARSDKKLKQFGKRHIRWVKNPLYFSFLLQTLKRRNWRMAKEFYKELSSMDNIFLLAMRWMILKTMRAVGVRGRSTNEFLFDKPSSIG